ncbi:hypothetical protein PSTG_08126 [Puccinia striiformis f. sp. tritici PST-78]|uniref:Cullin family profile domain-containing protein n=1 Tax=Puccinia striiformis f. sp. tritici PST-78 TaxID=1165861 RepID=A0A0L0VHX4_9BASI|nr:hypothetical protein PSTG_08126 [Puccinia striiformis f. sp. tritici PST-78]
MSYQISLEELQAAITHRPPSLSIERLSKAFETLHTFLQPVWPVPIHYVACPSAPCNVVEALECVIELNAQEELFDWYKGQIQWYFKHLKDETTKITSLSKDSHAHQLVFQLVKRWHVIFLTWHDPLRVLTPEDTSAYNLYSKYFHNCLLSCIPDYFPIGIKRIFTMDLNGTSTRLFEPSPNYPHSSLIQQLATLGLLKRFQPILFSVGYDAIDERIEKVCRGEWSDQSSSLEGMIGWFRQVIGVWLVKVLEAADQSITPTTTPADQPDLTRVIGIVRPAMSRFEYHIYKSLSDLRINELFDIIVDFPETMPVLEDLRICMNKTDQRSYLVHKLRAANTRRLLHPGADTQDIITQYISLMKALRVLDPPGVLLSCVAQPVRIYLRSREDTIRCIVTSLVEPGHTLGDELDQISDNDNPHQGLSSGLPIQEENDYHLTDWFPDPVDAPIGFKNLLKDDIIESLVTIYQNRDGFVKELQSLLASRLLAVKSFDVTQELTRIEILKGKFGEANLQPCDIMLKDLSDSKRIDTSVHELIPQAPIHPIIISRLFWPNLATTTFKFSPQLTELLKIFEQTYTTQKVDRRLCWLPQLGSVEIDVVLQDRTLSLEVSTLQASIIELFGISDTWTFSKLRIKLKIRSDFNSLKNSLNFWFNLHVLKEIQSGVWKLFESEHSFNSFSVKSIRNP